MSATIVVFGLSGAGKSHLACGLSAQRDDIVHVQASALLKVAKQRGSGAIVDAEELRRDKVVENQALLLKEFSALRAAEPRAIILDGHNVVDTPVGLQEIPFEVISELAPSGVVFVSDEPSAIAQRRAADVSRARPERTLENLRQHQAFSLQLARDHAERLEAPFAEIRSGDLRAFAEVVG